MIVIVYSQGFTVESGALITAWATIVAVVVAQLVTAWLAGERAQVESQQAYLKEMGELLSQNPRVRDLAAENQEDLRILARAHTLTVLSGLNPARQQVVLNYLGETRLLKAVGLADALDTHTSQASLEVPAPSRDIEADPQSTDPQSTDPQSTDPDETELGRAYLGRVDLSGSKLEDVEFDAADLGGADLRGAKLADVCLDKADLGGADLRGADLRGADLRRASLSGASLSGADLREVKGLTEEQLLAAHSLEGATMPNRQTLKSVRKPDGLTFEEWLKSKGSRKDRENSGPS